MALETVARESCVSRPRPSYMPTHPLPSSCSAHAPAAVVSRVLCTFPPERATLPLFIQVVRDRVDDTIAAGIVSEAGHGTRPAPDFAEGAFDGIGGPDTTPIAFWHLIVGEEGFPVPEHALDRVRRDRAPGADPPMQSGLGSCA